MKQSRCYCAILRHFNCVWSRRRSFPSARAMGAQFWFRPPTREAMSFSDPAAASGNNSADASCLNPEGSGSSAVSTIDQLLRGFGIAGSLNSNLCRGASKFTQVSGSELEGCCPVVFAQAVEFRGAGDGNDPGLLNQLDQGLIGLAVLRAEALVGLSAARLARMGWPITLCIPALCRGCWVC